MNSEVVIGVPVYNEEKYLDRVLASLERQNHSNIKVVVSNNGSTDRSVEIIQSYCERDPRFILHNQNTVLSAVENIRFLQNYADSNYFMWMGGHDFINDSYIGSCIAQLEKNPGAVMASGRVKWQREINGDYLDCNEALNTLHMPPRMAVLTWLWSFYSCFQFYGVFRSQIIKQIDIPSFYSPDIAFIAGVLLHGNAVFCGDAVYYATCNRPNETTKNQIRRYASEGISEVDLEYLSRPDARIGRFFLPCRNHILTAIRNSNWPLAVKLWTIIEVKRVFKSRLNYVLSS